MLVIGLVWGGICLAQFAASIGDLSAISGAKLVKLTLRVAVANVPLAAYCAALAWLFARPAGPPLTARTIAHSLGLGTLLCFIPTIALQATYLAIEQGKPAVDVLSNVANYPPLFLVYDYMMFAGSFAAVLAEAARQHKQLADQARERAERENLALRLALEQQRLRTLQAQLEPHFLFNSLNAISALVRAVNTSDALGAISTLSQLLRRAVHASLHPWLPLDDELQFARDYLKLQQLRYGERLVVRIDCTLDGHGDAEVPALLLQPLIENAIRHDVERHHGVATIALGLRAGGGQLDITLTNALCDSHAPNPGSGLGLANIRSRLALLYPGSHAFSAGPADGLYVVRLHLPLDGNA